MEMEVFQKKNSWKSQKLTNQSFKEGLTKNLTCFTTNKMVTCSAQVKPLLKVLISPFSLRRNRVKTADLRRKKEEFFE